MNLKTYSKEKKLGLFKLGVMVLVIAAAGLSFLLSLDSKWDILPVIMESRNFEDDRRSAGTFAEEHGPKASRSEVDFHADTSFTFHYTKSKQQNHAFAGVWFPLEDFDIDFSDYDVVEVKIVTQHARRIPFNLSVQNNLETHQYIRSLIEIEKGKTVYSFPLKGFFTPTEWYDRNGVAQIDIPDPDLSKIEALSFESCHLIEVGKDDSFTISRIVLIKELAMTYSIIWGGVILAGFGWWGLLFGFVRKEEEVIRVPVSHVEVEEPSNQDDAILLFLAENYTNPNLTLADLSKEFGKTGQEVSGIVKEKTKLTFPKYLNFLRIEEAKRLLKNGKYASVAELGYIVGFNSPSNFNRVFKGAEGISPKAYAEQVGE